MRLRWWRERPLELAPLEAYARWAASYPPAPHTPLMRVEQEGVLALLPDPAGQVALDLGCGSGRYLELLARRGARLAVGCDLSPEMLSRARAPGRTLLRADLLRLPLASASCGLVVCGLALGDVADLEAALAEIARVLLPGGAAVWSTLHPKGAPRWQRTFRDAAGRLCAVRGHPHGRARQEAACAAAGLAVEAVRELVGPDRAGRPVAVALAIRARRPGGAGNGRAESGPQRRESDA